MQSFVYAKIPLRPGAAEHMDEVHEAVEQALAARSAGTLIGWGRSVSNAGDAVMHHRLDIEVDGQARGLAVLKEALAGLGVPDGTELHYTVDGEALQIVRAGASWAEPVRSTATSRHMRRTGR
ncbi:hypothetical protein [Roseateles saccharophilus]|uniref:Uncharacterized protein n=1 Tax=Roseateles saccharophilus TaxID=304 RepID=A0A4R3VF74_ROSSA|nr:hypothetical protein [Roseateles saccharophilus]MDG0832271.1 hypothetical protein [Roseateles saccharophilus]TCV02354.1 hypothetical protein EV671_1004127 [Roseateles saccharophilus]